MKTNTTGSANSPAASGGSPNAEAAAVDPMSRLLEMQTALTDGEQPVTDDSPAGATEAPPAGGAEPGAATGEDGEGNPADTGQTEQSEETEDERLAREEAEAAEAGGAPEGALPAELANLEPDVREELLALAQDVQDGKTNFGDLKRGHKLIAKHAEEVERLQGEIEGLKTQLASAPAGAAAGGEFKTVKDVIAREQALEKVLDWCDDNAEGGERNGQQFTADEVKEARRNARDQLKYQLPAQKEKLQQQERAAEAFSQSQTAARPGIFKVFPELKDPEHKEGQAVTKMLAELPWMKKTFVSPELAALTWHLGELAVQERARKRGVTFDPKTGAAKAAAGPRPGTVQRPGIRTGRPSGGGGAAAATRPAGGPTVAKAKERIAQERSVGALADLMTAMEPGK